MLLRSYNPDIVCASYFIALVRFSLAGRRHTPYTTDNSIVLSFVIFGRSIRAGIPSGSNFISASCVFVLAILL